MTHAVYFYEHVSTGNKHLSCEGISPPSGISLNIEVWGGHLLCRDRLIRVVGNCLILLSGFCWFIQQKFVVANPQCPRSDPVVHCFCLS